MEAATNLLMDFKEATNERMRHAVSQGVIIEKVSLKACTDAVVSDIRRQLHAETGLQNIEVPNLLKTSKHIVLLNQYGEITKISHHDTIKVKSPNCSEEWIIKIEVILTGPVGGHYYTFCNGAYYVPVFQNGVAVHHPWTATPKFVPRMYQRNSVQPLTSYCRKVMMYPESASVENTDYFLCIGYIQPELVKTVKVPIYPKVGETLRIKGTRNEEWHGKVVDVDVDERKASVQWYRETQRKNIWTITTSTDDIPFNSIIGLTTTK